MRAPAQGLEAFGPAARGTSNDSSAPGAQSGFPAPNLTKIEGKKGPVFYTATL
jgi:hypothetical protein